MSAAGGPHGQGPALPGEDGLVQWDGRPVETLRADWGVPALVVLRNTTSTNDVARRLAEAGAGHGTTVVADHQSAGRGRHGRAWRDRPGGALLLSMVLRPSAGGPSGASDARAARDATASTAAADAGALPLLVGLACAHAIRSCCDAGVRIEWPNDLVVDDRKLGGILCEAARRAGALDFVVAGVGINVDAPPDELDAATRARATSLVAACGRAVGRVRLAGEVARRLARLAADAPLDATSLDELRRLDALAGRRIRMGTGREGVAVRILADGALEVDADDGDRLVLRSGSVAPTGARSAD